MTDSEYKSYICAICNRIINQKLINIVKDINNEKLVFKLQIVTTEWYTELDDDVKFNVENNLQNLFKPLIIKAINEAKEDRENIQKINNKRQKT
tara:strand:+ start:217 stop:498 length:282 start_codon:yes stop_codon:yes gene_type:complete